MNRKIKSYLILNTLVLGVVLFYLFFLSKTTLFIDWRLKAVDSLFIINAKQAVSSPHLKELVIVGVDEESYRKVHRPMPWGREVDAVFLENLSKLDPKVVGIDFTYVGLSQNPKADEWLAKAIASSGRVVLASFFDKDYRYYPPDAIFKKEALASGYIDKPYDRDGISRRLKGFIRLNESEQPVYPFSTEIAFAWLGLKPAESIHPEGSDLIYSLPEKVSAPIDKKNQWWIPYRYRLKNFKYIPYWKMIAGQVDPAEVRGKIMLIGPTSPLFHDIHNTPLGLMPGIVMNANETMAILDRDFLRRFSPDRYNALIIIFALVLVFLFYRLQFLVAFALLVVTEGLIYGTSAYLFIKHRLIFEPLPLMMIAAVTCFIVVFYRSIKTVLENATLQRQVITDALTGLYGVRYLTLRFEAEFRKHQETKNEFCFVMIDIDFFKKVNDTYGHEHGNAVLITVAKMIKTGIRGYDVAARYGGEEFCVLFFQSNEQAALHTMDRIRQMIEAQKFWTPQGNMSVTISAGICSNKNADVKSHDDMKRLADEALYEAKHGGRNQVKIYQAKGQGH